MEIGSEFWKIDKAELNSDNHEFFKFGEDVKFTFLGRTAIDYVLQEIVTKREVKSVYFPNYCCDSMMEPFLNYGIEIKFYDVYYDNGLKYDINTQEECDVFFAMNYFGYSSTNMEEYVNIFNRRGIIVIEDITHSIFSKKKFCKDSDFFVGSLRKWLPLASGGIAVKNKGQFDSELNSLPKDLVNSKNRAMDLKKIYIENLHKDSKLKEEYLREFENFNSIIVKNYKNYRIDEDSFEILMKIDLEKMIKTRKENVKCIYEKLKNDCNMNFLIEKYDEDDCLLFVPIMLEIEKRNQLRNRLIANEVYLPIHWYSSRELSSIPKQELSLICDQRYNVNDINKYIKLIRN